LIFSCQNNISMSKIDLCQNHIFMSKIDLCQINISMSNSYFHVKIKKNNFTSKQLIIGSKSEI